jgi:colanic acid biosynthesis glycosyl transferase WcaI
MSLEPSYTIVGINYWPEPTGNAPYNTDLAEELSKKTPLTVITGIPHYPWWKKQSMQGDSEYRSRNPNVELIRLNHIVPKRQSNLSRAFMEVTFGLNVILSRRLRGNMFILVSPAMLSSALVLAWLKMTRRRSKTLVWVQDLYEQGLRETEQNTGMLARVVARIENWTFRNADHVVMAHPAFLTAKGLDQLDSVKYSSIPNWSQFKFDPTEGVAQTLLKYGLEGRRVVLHIGNMGVKQGLENVIEAGRIAENQDSTVTFAFVGAGNQLPKLHELAVGLGNVKFIPPVSESELANLLQAADLLLVNEMTGVKEMSIPSKLTTYFLAEKPVLVCSEAESLAGRSVIENTTGFWVQSGTPDALLAKIESLDLEEAKIVVKKAKEFAEVNLSKEAALSKFSQTLHNL